MTESAEPQTPEGAVALRELAATHRCRHRWVALFSSVVVAVSRASGTLVDACSSRVIRSGRRWGSGG
jgi:hypothetical protein